MRKGKALTWPMMSIAQCFNAEWDFEGLASFSCDQCKTRVERKLKCLPGSPFTLTFLGCACPGCIVHYVHDPAPANSRQWRHVLKKLRRSGSDILILNRNPNDQGTLGQN